MKWDTLKIDKVCLQSKLRNPGKNPKEPFLYIDLSSIDRSYKKIKSAHKLIGSEAPKQARNIIREGDILVSTVRPNQNSVAIVPRKFDGQIASTCFCVLRPITAAIEKKFLFYFTTTLEFIDILESKADPSNFSAVSEADVREINLPLPGLSEQVRIVKILEKADFLRMKCTEAIEKTARILPALFYNKFGDPTTNPKRWPTKLLGEVTVGKPQYGPRSRTIDWTDGVPRLIRITDITKDGHLQESEFVTLDLDNWTPFQLSLGDFLFAWSGTVGKTYMYRQKDGFCIYDKFFIRFKVDQSQVLPEYMFALTQTEFYRNWVKVRKTESPLPKISDQEFSSLPVPCPPIQLQEEFAKKFEVLACVRESQTKLKIRIKHLFDLLLKTAFSGDLTAQWRDTHIKELYLELQEQKKALENQSLSTNFSNLV